MSRATLDDITEMLERVVESSEDPETNFRVRTALQYLDVLQEQESEMLAVVEDECESRDVFARLRELGYVE